MNFEDRIVGGEKRGGSPIGQVHFHMVMEGGGGQIKAENEKGIIKLCLINKQCRGGVGVISYGGSLYKKRVKKEGNGYERVDILSIH